METANSPRGQAIHTPWGPSQTQRKYADGVVFHNTASHGGFQLNSHRQQTVKEYFPHFETFSGAKGWYEEDEDWCVVAIVFPDLFDAQQLRSAVAIATHAAQRGDRGWHEVLEYLQSDKGVAIKNCISNWDKDNANNWIPGSRGTDEKGWRIIFRRVSDGKERTIYMKEYPMKYVYTDNELSQESVAQS